MRDYPFAAVLVPGEQREFRGTLTVIRGGIDDVLAQRSRSLAWPPGVQICYITWRAQL